MIHPMAEPADIPLAGSEPGIYITYREALLAQMIKPANPLEQAIAVGQFSVAALVGTKYCSYLFFPEAGGDPFGPLPTLPLRAVRTRGGKHKAKKDAWFRAGWKFGPHDHGNPPPDYSFGGP